MSENSDKEKFTRGFCVSRDLFIEGKRVPQLLSSKCEDRSSDDLFRDLMHQLNEEIEEININQDYLENFVRRFRNAERFEGDLEAYPASLGGISGINTLLYLEHHLVDRGFLTSEDIGLICDPGKLFEYRSKLCGKIIKYTFNDKEKSGHLCVDLIHEQFCTREEFLLCAPQRTTYYRWVIDVLEGGYKVIERNDSKFPKDPFPPIPNDTFPTHSLDPTDERGIWFRCLDHKLVAEGKAVVIKDIYRQIGDEGECIRLDEQIYEHLYQSTDQSCVDIMFRGYPPECELPDQVEYCLGRCAHPPIINSGGK